MVNRPVGKGRPPLDEAGLERIALRYVERYASTRRRLTDYLRRKLRERGWASDGEPPVDALVEKIAVLGYVDDAAWAAQRHAALHARGFGERQVSVRLRQAGIGEDIAEGLRGDDEAAFRAAETFARRRRIGAFSTTAADERARKRAFDAMLRAGHDFTLARRFVDALPGQVPEWEN